MAELKEFMSKSNLRAELLRRRAAVSDKPELVRRATENLLPLLSGGVLVYVSIGSEMSTELLINELLRRDGIAVYAPYTIGAEITPLKAVNFERADRLGNMPRRCYDGSAVASDIKYCVTPLLGFNSKGYRIGYGKGCYDRFFARTDVIKIGFAFDCQRVEFEPEACDVPLDCCVTESGVIYFK